MVSQGSDRCIVIPTLNEEEAIGKVLDELKNLHFKEYYMYSK